MKDDWISARISEYYNWLKDRTQVSRDSETGWHVISTPFIGLFNDTIEIYIKKSGEKITLSDDGQTFYNLDLSGFSISRSLMRKEWCNTVLLNYGVTLNDDNELVTDGMLSDFCQKKHNLICAILEISDMAMMSKHTVSSLFKENVKNFFDEQNIIYTPQFIAKGTTGLEFTFDFQIAGKNFELVIKSFNVISKLNVPNFLFSWDDIKPAREKISGKSVKGLAIINDVDREVKPEFIGALESRGAAIMPWSKRHQPEMLEKLNAA
ncbi:MAG: DUF1828 domain-containing protein [Prevotellaceae bacterium]|jgi:hypothetical protein|nr:DUF1828 domain-containing protein [Prevotellaceae bacterium]